MRDGTLSTIGLSQSRVSVGVAEEQGQHVPTRNQCYKEKRLGIIRFGNVSVADCLIVARPHVWSYLERGDTYVLTVGLDDQLIGV